MAGVVLADSTELFPPCRFCGAIFNSCIDLCNHVCKEAAVDPDKQWTLDMSAGRACSAAAPSTIAIEGVQDVTNDFEDFPTCGPPSGDVEQTQMLDNKGETEFSTLEYEVKLDLACGRDYGVSFTEHDKGLRIEIHETFNCKQTSAVAKWNANQKQKICFGDLIVNVNEVVVPQDMLKELWKDSAVHMKIKALNRKALPPFLFVTSRYKPQRYSGKYNLVPERMANGFATQAD